MTYNDLFHVHTRRCRHAGEETDTDYIETAISLGAKSIFFTDHAPFPGDILGNRMHMEELPEYYGTLMKLKKAYADRIDVKIGLEIEYLPEFEDYYRFLLDTYDMKLFLGQHVCKYKGEFNFEYMDKSEEFQWLTDSVMQAVQKHYFAGVFHPERMFRNCVAWGTEQEAAAKSIWTEADTIEYNYSAVNSTWHEEFWKYKSHDNILYGIDAHSTSQLIAGTKYFRENM